MESEDNSRPAEEQLVNISQSDQNSAKAIDTPAVEQIFRDWEKFDLFISLYAKTQNFVSVIRGSEYDKGEEDDETTSNCSSSNKENFIEIEDPVVHARRGAPKRKRFKGFHELDGKKKPSVKKHSNAQKSRKPTQCQQCQNTGHNKAGCEAWYKRQGVPYSY
ncbi:6221_t:CDS:2 [Racocetra persica]|uniref:6221_t:CDS:1 n=1 Tax=Racocetra persica TaxID=160502 RepID=A0ACA9L1J0_9GLOM|nr:6221_t:CDS:2 [Racocetra persica]